MPAAATRAASVQNGAPTSPPTPAVALHELDKRIVDRGLVRVATRDDADIGAVARSPRAPARHRRPSRPGSSAARPRSTQRRGKLDSSCPPSITDAWIEPVPDERVRRPRLQARVELVERDEDRAHLHDRVHAEVGSRAVRGDALSSRSRSRRSRGARRRPAARSAQRRSLRRRSRARARSSVPTEASSSSATAVTITSPRWSPAFARRDEHRRQRALHVIATASVEPAARRCAARTAPPYLRRRPCRDGRSGAASGHRRDPAGAR